YRSRALSVPRRFPQRIQPHKSCRPDDEYQLRLVRAIHVRNSQNDPARRPPVVLREKSMAAVKVSIALVGIHGRAKTLAPWFGALPDVRIPTVCDMQLLWCPHYHGKCLGPICRGYWRSEAVLRAGTISPPAASTAERHLLPRSCVLYPERVTEYQYSRFCELYQRWRRKQDV